MRLPSARLANESERLLGEMPEAEIVERPGRAGEHLLSGLRLWLDQDAGPTTITRAARADRGGRRRRPRSGASSGNDWTFTTSQFKQRPLHVWRPRATRTMRDRDRAT